jgi:hypothetical protein
MDGTAYLQTCDTGIDAVKEFLKADADKQSVKSAEALIHKPCKKLLPDGIAYELNGNVYIVENIRKRLRRGRC